MLKNTKLPFSDLPVCFFIKVLHKHHQFLFTVQKQKQAIFTNASFFISSNLIAWGEAKGDFCSITLQTVWKQWIYHIISSSSSLESRYMGRILKPMLFAQNVMPFLTCYISVSKNAMQNFMHMKFSGSSEGHLYQISLLHN
jgi:hypothetical protein